MLLSATKIKGRAYCTRYAHTHANDRNNFEGISSDFTHVTLASVLLLYVLVYGWMCILHVPLLFSTIFLLHVSLDSSHRCRLRYCRSSLSSSSSCALVKFKLKWVHNSSNVNNRVCEEREPSPSQVKNLTLCTRRNNEFFFFLRRQVQQYDGYFPSLLLCARLRRWH